MKQENSPTARVIAVQDDVVSIEAIDGINQPLIKNEVIYIRPGRSEARRSSTGPVSGFMPIRH